MNIICELFGHRYIVVEKTIRNNLKNEEGLIKQIVSWWACTRCGHGMANNINLYDKEDLIK